MKVDLSTLVYIDPADFTDEDLDMILADVDLTTDYRKEITQELKDAYDVTYVIAGCMGKDTVYADSHLEVMRQFDLDHSRGDHIFIQKVS